MILPDLDIFIYITPFGDEIVCDGRPQAIVGYPVCTICLMWQVAPGKLMFALGSCFDKRQFLSDGVFYGLIITHFKMEKGVVAQGAPVTTVQTVLTDKIQSTGHIFVPETAHDQQNLIRH